MKDRKYTIQEIRDMLCKYANEMNPYKYIDAADGMVKVQKFLEGVQNRDRKEVP